MILKILQVYSCLVSLTSLTFFLSKLSLINFEFYKYRKLTLKEFYSHIRLFPHKPN